MLCACLAHLLPDQGFICRFRLGSVQYDVPFLGTGAFDSCKPSGTALIFRSEGGRPLLEVWVRPIHLVGFRGPCHI
jgi:hypothetical protein